MTESKFAATERLRKEGRWEAASLFRDERRKQLRKAGRKRDEANELSWQAMLNQYPPLPPAATEPKPEPATLVDDGELETLREKSANSEPDIVRDTLWVYERIEDGRVSHKNAPSLGAIGLLQWARSDRQRFFEQMLPKAMVARSKQEEEQTEKEEQGRRHDDRIENELHEMLAEMERRRLQDTPDEIKMRCRECICEWQKKRGLNLPFTLADTLALELAHFVDEYVQAGIKYPDQYRRKE